MKRTEMILKSLPPPSLPHIQAIEELLQKVLAEYTASDKENEMRRQAFVFLEKTITENIPGGNIHVPAPCLFHFLGIGRGYNDFVWFNTNCISTQIK
jgi:hypothetical protein